MNKINYYSYEYIIDNNLHLVYKVASRFEVDSKYYDNLVEAGLMGLYFAAKDYDIRNKVNFSNFAIKYIVTYIRKSLESLTNLTNNLKQNRYAISNTNFNVGEILNKLNIDKEQLIDLVAWL